MERLLEHFSCLLEIPPSEPLDCLSLLLPGQLPRLASSSDAGSVVMATGELVAVVSS
jgi:hypothetical protein